MDPLESLSTWSGIPAESFADAVFNRYAARLMHVARERLGRRMRAKVSPEDVVQSAFKSFFRRQDEFRFDNDRADGLWGLLVVITLRKCAKWADVFGAAKRAADRETPLAHGDSVRGAWRELASREPGPDDAAMLAEMVEWLLRQLEPRQQAMISLRMQGYELEEIAQQLQSSRRTVSRAVAEAKAQLQEYLTQELAPQTQEFPS